MFQQMLNKEQKKNPFTTQQTADSLILLLQAKNMFNDTNIDTDNNGQRRELVGK